MGAILNMKPTFIAIALCLAAITNLVWGQALPPATGPKIEFESKVFDFGKTSQVESISGVFKFKNVGTEVLKITGTKPTCGCTIPALKKDTLQPGETSEVSFTLNLGKTKAHIEKQIKVTSNDTSASEVALTIKGDFTPLYDTTPTTLAPTIALGGKSTNLFVTLARTDGKPLRIARIDGSKPWIKAKVDPSAKQDDTSAKILVDVESDGVPRRFNEYVQIYAGDTTNSPVSTIYVYGRMLGEVVLSPEALYWSITDVAKVKTDMPEAQITRRLNVTSSSGKEFTITNVTSSVPGVNVEVIPKDGGKAYEIVAKLKDINEKTLSGSLSFQTSVASQPKVDVPIQIYVYQPPAKISPLARPTTNAVLRPTANVLQRSSAPASTVTPPLPPVSK